MPSDHGSYIPFWSLGVGEDGSAGALVFRRSLVAGKPCIRSRLHEIPEPSAGVEQMTVIVVASSGVVGAACCRCVYGDCLALAVLAAGLAVAEARAHQNAAGVESESEGAATEIEAGANRKREHTGRLERHCTRPNESTQASLRGIPGLTKPASASDRRRTPRCVRSS